MEVTDNEYTLAADITEIWMHMVACETPAMQSLGLTFWMALCAIRDGKIEAKA